MLAVDVIGESDGLGSARGGSDTELEDVEVVVVVDGLPAIIDNGNGAAGRQALARSQGRRKGIVFGGQAQSDGYVCCHDDESRSVIGEGLVGLVVGVDIG